MASKRKSKNIEHIMDNLRQQNLNISNENDSYTKQLRISEEILSKNMAVIQSITNNFFQQNSVTNNNNCLLTMNIDQQQRQQQQVADQSIETPPPPSTTTPSTTTNDDISIYRGLYPINEVKQYFEKQIIDGKKKYKCLWNDCQFSTWNYSQHISRHIYLKHIGIKKLQCNIPNCGKMFKRPESLVQHKKNHNCGFGIDNQRMKDPKNLCGDRNIRHYFSRQLDNDIFVYQCQFGQCKFHTHNSGSIRRHVHNQHICPFSASNSNNNNNNNNNSNQSNNNNYNNIQQQQQQQEYSTTTTKNHQNNNNIDDRKSIIYYDDSNDSNDQLSTSPLAANVEVQLNEFDNQSYDPERRQIIQSKPCEQQQQKKLPLSLSPSTTTTTTTTMNEDSFEDFPIEDFDDIEDDIDDDDDIDVDVNIDDDDDDDDDIDEDIDDNHSINGQNQIIEHLQQTSSMIQLTNVDNDDDDDDDDYNSENELTIDNNNNNNKQNNIMATNNNNDDANDNHHQQQIKSPPSIINQQQPSNGLYSLKNFQGQFRKERNELNVVEFICNHCELRAPSQITLVRHLWIENGYKNFTCDNCDQIFDSEVALYKHRKNIHQQTTTSSSSSSSMITSSPIPVIAPMQQQQQTSSISNSSTYLPQTIVQQPISSVSSSSSNNDNSMNVLQQQQQDSRMNSEYLNALMSQSPMNFKEQFEQFLMIIQSQQQQQLFLQQQSQTLLNGMNRSAIEELLQSQQQQQQQQHRYDQQTLSTQTSNLTMFDRIKNPDGSNEFRCRICQSYIVRCRQSIKKHMKKYHSQQQQSSTTMILPMQKLSSQQQQQQQQKEQQIENQQQQQPDEEELYDNNNNNINMEIESNESIPDDLNSEQQQQQQQNNSGNNSRDKNGLYSLKKFPGYFRRERMPDGSPGHQYVCLKCFDGPTYATKSQASMIRHIWQHKPQNFHCQICSFPCENEFALYKHKKKEHPESTSQHNRTKSSSSSNRNTVSSKSINHQPPPSSSSSSSSPLMDNIIQQQHHSSSWINLDEQINPISLVKHIMNNEGDDHDDDDDEDDQNFTDINSSLMINQNQQQSHTIKQAKTSRRNLQFKTYKYNQSPSSLQIDNDDDEYDDDDDDEEI